MQTCETMQQSFLKSRCHLIVGNTTHLVYKYGRPTSLEHSTTSMDCAAVYQSTIFERICINCVYLG